MKRLILCLAILDAALAVAQTCIISAPTAPPVPTVLTINLPPNGATQGCTVQVPILTSGSNPNMHTYALGNAKCATAVGIALQAASNDNGWNDGGVP